MEEHQVLKQYPSGCALLDLVETLSDASLKTAIIRSAAALLKEVAGGAKADAPDAKRDLTQAFDASTALCVVPGLSFTSPRGKFNMALVPYESIILMSEKVNIIVPMAAITAMVILDAIPKDTKGKVLMMLALSKQQPVMNGKTQLEAIMLQTTATARVSVTTNTGEVLDDGTALVVCTALGKAGLTQDFVCPDPTVFQSAKGDAAIAANFKVTGGYLFPLPEALCFVERPALFIPHVNIRYVELSRTASSSFDLAVHMTEAAGGDVVEFGQIDRQELGRLQSYFATCRIKTSLEEAQAAEAKAAGKVAAGAPQLKQAGPAEADDGDEDDDEDEDFDPEADSDEEQARPAKRKRTAGGAGPGPSTSAAAAAEDDGEDEDEEDYEDDDEDDDEDDEDEDEDEEVEFEDEEGFEASKLQELMDEDRGPGRRGRRKAAQQEEDDE